MRRKVLQHDLTIVKAIDRDLIAQHYGGEYESGLEKYKERLRKVGDKIQGKMNSEPPYVLLPGLEELHFLSVTVIPASAGKKGDEVMLELGFDGSPRRFLFKLVRLCLSSTDDSLLDTIFGPCRGYERFLSRSASDKRPLSRLRDCWRCWQWLRAGRLRSTFYNGHIGYPRKSILNDQALREKVSDCAMTLQTQVTSRRQLWDKLHKKFKSHDDVRWRPKLPLRVRMFHRDYRERSWFRYMLATKVIVVAAGLAYVAVRLNDLGRGPQLQAPWQLPYTSAEFWVLLILPVIAGLVAAVVWASEFPSQIRLGIRVRGWASAFMHGAFVTVMFIAILGFLALVFTEDWEFKIVLAIAVVISAITVLIACIVLIAFGPVIGSVASLLLASLVVFLTYEHLGPDFNPMSPLPGDVLLRYLKIWLLVVILTALLPVLLIAARLAYVRREELGDDEDAIALDKKKMDLNRARENDQLHSHFAATRELKLSKGPTDTGGNFRVTTLRILFRLLTFLHRYYLTQGWLGTISSIHFARWIIQDDNRMLFLTNYDGGFAAYLGAFSENLGTTGVFGHVKGFPRPYFLLWDGARRQQQFIDFARANQMESLIWYSAYPEITVMDIVRAARLCRALSRPAASDKVGLVADICRAYRWPMTEAEISDILRTTLGLSAFR